MLTRVRILSPFYCSMPGGKGRDMRAGEVTDEVPARLIDQLVTSKTIERVDAAPEDAPDAPPPAKEAAKAEEGPKAATKPEPAPKKPLPPPVGRGPRGR